MTERDTGYWVRFAFSLQETNPHIVLGDELAAFLIGQGKRIAKFAEAPAKQLREAQSVTEERVRSYGVEPRSLQWKWRELDPPRFEDRQEWYQECSAALLDALVNEGGIPAWDGDGLSCAVQIVEAYAKRLADAERRDNAARDLYAKAKQLVDWWDRYGEPAEPDGGFRQLLRAALTNYETLED